MKSNKYYIKIVTIFFLLISPILLFSDGGNPLLYCSSYTDYYAQPTILTLYELDITNFKINGKSQDLSKDIEIETPYYSLKSSGLDTLFLTDMKINEENTNINCVSVFGEFCK